MLSVSESRLPRFCDSMGVPMKKPFGVTPERLLFDGGFLVKSPGFRNRDPMPITTREHFAPSRFSSEQHFVMRFFNTHAAWLPSQLS
jgi:hypothetical protein